MGYTCEQCGRRRSGPPHLTVTGRKLCGSCNDRLVGLATGTVASGGDPGSSIATAGWFTSWRERRRERRAAGEGGAPANDRDDASCEGTREA